MTKIAIERLILRLHSLSPNSPVFRGFEAGFLSAFAGATSLFFSICLRCNTSALSGGNAAAIRIFLGLPRPRGAEFFGGFVPFPRAFPGTKSSLLPAPLSDSWLTSTMLLFWRACLCRCCCLDCFRCSASSGGRFLGRLLCHFVGEHLSGFICNRNMTK